MSNQIVTTSIDTADQKEVNMSDVSVEAFRYGPFVRVLAIGYADYKIAERKDFYAGKLFAGLTTEQAREKHLNLIEDHVYAIVQEMIGSGYAVPASFWDILDYEDATRPKRIVVMPNGERRKAEYYEKRRVAVHA